MKYKHYFLYVLGNRKLVLWCLEPKHQCLREPHLRSLHRLPVYLKTAITVVYLFRFSVLLRCVNPVTSASISSSVLHFFIAYPLATLKCVLLHFVLVKLGPCTFLQWLILKTPCMCALPPCQVVLSSSHLTPGSRKQQQTQTMWALTLPSSSHGHIVTA